MDGVVAPALISVTSAKEIAIMILIALEIWYVALTIVVLTFQVELMKRGNCIIRIVAPKPTKVTKTIIPYKTCLTNHNTVLPIQMVGL